jgi:hypothetical protein
VTVDTVTKTKRRLIAADITGVDGTIPWDRVLGIANRHHLRPGEVRDVIASFGIPVADMPVVVKPKGPPVTAIPQASVVAAPKPAIDPVVARSILSGSIYKRLSDPEPGEDPAQVFVLTTLSQWRRERAAIAALIRSVTP